MTDAMQRGEDGNIRYFTGSFGQIAAVSREGQLIKAVPLTNLDVKLEQGRLLTKELRKTCRQKPACFFMPEFF